MENLGLFFLPFPAMRAVLMGFSAEEVMRYFYVIYNIPQWRDIFVEHIRLVLPSIRFNLDAEVPVSCFYMVIRENRRLDYVHLSSNGLLSTVGKYLLANLNDMGHVKRLAVSFMCQPISLRVRGSKLDTLKLLEVREIQLMKIVAPNLKCFWLQFVSNGLPMYVVPSLAEYSFLEEVYLSQVIVNCSLVCGLASVPLRQLRLLNCNLIAQENAWDVFYENSIGLTELYMVWDDLSAMSFRACMSLYDAVCSNQLVNLRTLACHFLLYYPASRVGDDLSDVWHAVRFDVRHLPMISTMFLHIDETSEFLLGNWLLEMVLLPDCVLQFIGRQRQRWNHLDTDRWVQMGKLLIAFAWPRRVRFSIAHH